MNVKYTYSIDFLFISLCQADVSKKFVSDHRNKTDLFIERKVCIFCEITSKKLKW